MYLHLLGISLGALGASAVAFDCLMLEFHTIFAVFIATMRVIFAPISPGFLL